MTEPGYKLWFAPGTCARVSMIALEETGIDFDTRLIAFKRGDHRSDEFLALNPKGKVPTLEVDGEVLTENLAIVTYLSKKHPDAKLLPFGKNEMSDARILEDLAWCASGLHPIVTRLRLPQYFCDTEDGRVRVWEMAAAAMKPNFALIEQRLADSEWMLGRDWSVLDAYVFWVWFRVEGAGFDVSAYPNFADHARRIQQRPSVMRAGKRERQAIEWLTENDLMLDLAAPVGGGTGR